MHVSLQGFNMARTFQVAVIQHPYPDEALPSMPIYDSPRCEARWKESQERDSVRDEGPGIGMRDDNAGCMMTGVE